MTEPHIAWVTLQPGQLPCLIRNLPSRKMEVLAVISKKLTYEPTLPFYDIVEEAVSRSVARADLRGLTTSA